MGEAVVRKGKESFDEPLKDRTLTGDEGEYDGQVTFEPSSIRLYAPPVHVDRIQPLLGEKDITKFAGAYTDLPWSVYARVLQAVVSQGAFVT